MVEYQNGMVAIHPRHNKLLIALRTAVENGEGMLDKEAKALQVKSNVLALDIF